MAANEHPKNLNFWQWIKVMMSMVQISMALKNIRMALESLVEPAPTFSRTTMQPHWLNFFSCTLSLSSASSSLSDSSGTGWWRGRMIVQACPVLYFVQQYHDSDIHTIQMTLQIGNVLLDAIMTLNHNLFSSSTTSSPAKEKILIKLLKVSQPCCKWSYRLPQYMRYSEMCPKTNI